MVALNTLNQAAGMTARLEDEIQMQKAIIRRIDPSKLSLIPEARDRLDRLERMLMALRRTPRRPA